MTQCERGSSTCTGGIGVVILSITLCASNQSLAAELEEIIVTAQKRERNLQDVPISVTAFTSEELDALNLSDTVSLHDYVPNMTIVSTLNPQFFLRGIGNRDVNAPAQSKVGVYQDQVYQGLLVAQQFQLFDLERVEVLKGPQGTLYGKNTTGGALNVASRLPNGTQNGFFRLDIGNYDYLSIEGAAGFPLTDEISARVAGVVNQRDGWAVNVADDGPRRLNDLDNYAVRAMLRYENERLDLLLRLTRGRDRSTFPHSQPNTDFSPFGGATIGGFVNNFPDETVMATDLDIFQDVDHDGIALILNYEFEPFILTSISSYDKAELRALQDADSSPDSLVDIGWRTNSRQITQEFRIADNDAASPLDYLIGVFFVDEQLEDGTGTDFRVFEDALPAFGPTLDLKQDMGQDAQQVALFADFSYALNDQWSVNGGLRYTIDEKEFFTVAELTGINDVPPPDPIFTVPLTTFDEQWEEITGHVGLEWRPKQDLMLYTNLSRGFNGGGFNGGAIVDPGEATSFDPEFLNAVEIGAKSNWLERRLIANVAVFYYDYTDLQVQITTTSPFTNNFIQIIENAADAEIIGAEIEITALLTDYLRFTGGLGLLHSEFKNFQSIIGDFSGNQLPDAPEVDFSSVLHYERPFEYGAWFLRGEFKYTSNRFSNATEEDFVSTNGEQEIMNLKAGWTPADERWRVTLWVRNITDNQYVDRALDLNQGFGFITNWFHEPRTYGIQMAYHFD